MIAGTSEFAVTPNCYRCGSQPCTCADGCTLYLGDCLEVLKQLPSGIVHSVVVSPPYFALRSYLPKDHPDKAKEIGSEPTPEAFIATMVEVFREVRRVLRDDGVCWVNLGDGYGNSGGAGTQGATGQRASRTHTQSNLRLRRGTDCDPKRGPAAADQPKPKSDSGQLQNIPHRVAEALRQDGWIWRQTIVWAKRSPMPESVSGWRWMQCRVKIGNAKRANGYKGESTDGRPQGGYAEDGKSFANGAEWQPCPGCHKCEPNGGYVLRRGSGRCTTAHEYVFLLTKTNKYFWDSEASKESTGKPVRMMESFRGGGVYTGGKSRQNSSSASPVSSNEWTASSRNPRSVWTISSEPTSVRHFATFPSELVRRCLASSPSKVCPTCGAPWAPVVESERVATRPGTNHKAVLFDAGEANVDPHRHVAVTQCRGYRQTCSCPAHEPIGGLVLDPFCGIGTTGQTARQLGMRFIGIDLNSEYLDHAKVRITEKPRWWIRKHKPKAKKKQIENKEQMLLFTSERVLLP